jgi:hypothetical protein
VVELLRLKEELFRLKDLRYKCFASRTCVIITSSQGLALCLKGVEYRKSQRERKSDEREKGTRGLLTRGLCVNVNCENQCPAQHERYTWSLCVDVICKRQYPERTIHIETKAARHESQNCQDKSRTKGEEEVKETIRNERKAQ